MFWRIFLRGQIWWMLSLLSLLVVACGRGQQEMETTLTTIITPSAPESDIFFPQLSPVEGTRETMTADLFGQLVLVDSCLRVNNVSEVDNSVTSVLLVWPPEFRLNVEGDVVQILDGTGQIVARIGDQIWTGGGGFGDAEGYLGPCPGPVFEVGEGFRVGTPTPLEDSE